MTTSVHVIFTVVVISNYIQQGCSNQGPHYQLLVDHPKRMYAGYGGSYYSPPIIQSHQSGHNCSEYQEYRTLLQLKDHKSCLRAIDVWPLLESLSLHGGTNDGPKCRVNLIHQLSVAFGNIAKTPDYCQCHGHVNLSNFPYKDFSVSQNCLSAGSSDSTYYQSFYHEYYSDEDNHWRQCTHHHIWHPLSQIQSEYCQRNMITNLAYTFSHYVPDFHCNQVSTVHPSTLHAESTTLFTSLHPTTVASKMDTTPFSPHIAIPTCDKYGTMNAIIHGTVVSHSTASDCVQGDHRASEALVLSYCHTNGVHTWTKGPAVMNNCAQIPLYAPVATFSPHGLFISNGGLAGIFLGCLTDGFKMATQVCCGNSTVQNIVIGGLFTHDPAVYSVVLF